MSRRLALLIGNQGFAKDSGFEPLRGPHNDVDALARVLGDPVRGGFEPVEVLKDAQLLTLAATLERVLCGATAKDEVLIHYSGHGQLDDYGRLFFTAVNSAAKHLGVTALRASDLQEWMARSPAASVVLFLDCCFAGAFGKVLTGGLRGPVEASIQQQLREAVQRASGRFILTSSTSWQTAQEAEGEADGVWMGRFTRAVVARLEGGAGDAAGEIRFSHLAAGLQGAFQGHEPRAFVADGGGDPLIARSLPRETPEQRRVKLLTAWVEAEQLPVFVYAPAFEALHGNGPAGLIKRVQTLLDAPGMTAGAFAAAVRNALPGEVPRPWPFGGIAPPPPRAAAPRPSLPRRLVPALSLVIVPLAAAIYVYYPREPDPPPPRPPR